MIFYLSYNDGPSGIFSSQVIDVVKFIRSEFNIPIRLVAFISIRNFLKQRRSIKQELPAAIVLPMVPGIGRWRWNIFSVYCLLVLFRPKLIIGRSVIATQLALRSKNPKQRVVYDGRGAIAAEWKEYKVVSDQKLLNEIEGLERSAILDSDFRIAVSGQLLEFWQTNYGYKGRKHVIIPCTINAAFEHMNLNEQSIARQRKLIGIKEEDVVFVYSGSLAGWQSFDLLRFYITPLLSSERKIRILFLTDKDANIAKLEVEYPEQVICRKVRPAEVPAMLMCADYGLLIREQTITNRVASPVKFAEYLACGLKVVISDHLGDYSEFIQTHDCGYAFPISFAIIKPSQQEKAKMRGLALNYFTKKIHTKAYSEIMKSGTGNYAI
ncbi:MAG: hypothetical protein JNK73_06655 [Bacteroidia bacterium]|nr:hypothetical protein [Bacteroidia bacterium]